MEMILKRSKKTNYRKSGAAAAKKARKREEAMARQAAYAKLSVAQRIAKLDAGGFKATKQRAKLAAQGATR